MISLALYSRARRGSVTEAARDITVGVVNALAVVMGRRTCPRSITFERNAPPFISSR